jgi:hypothetical protein
MSCHCKFDWDYRCGCFPPSTQEAKDYCSKFRRELFWHKSEDVKDNWAKCPVRIVKSVQFVKDTLCNESVGEQTKLLVYMGLSSKDVKDATVLLEEEESDEDADEDEEETASSSASSGHSFYGFGEMKHCSICKDWCCYTKEDYEEIFGLDLHLQCDCCYKSWDSDKPNKRGVCDCAPCNKCGKDAKDCRYKCEFYTKQ